MKKNPFAVDQGLLTEEELLYIDETVTETFRYGLVGRPLYEVKAIGQGGGAQFYRWYDESDPSEASITMTGKAQVDDHPEKTAHDLNVPVIHKEFFLNWRDIASSRRDGPSSIDDCVRTATWAVQNAEDRLLISGETVGWPAMGIEGLFTATGRTTNPASGNWPANAAADINTARAALQTAGFVSIEPVLLGPPALIKCLDAFIANTAVTYRQAFLDNSLISDAIETPNAFAAAGTQNSVVLVVPGNGNFQAITDLPLEVLEWYDKTQNVYGTVRETIVPAIKRPAAIAEISTITCV